MRKNIEKRMKLLINTSFYFFQPRQFLFRKISAQPGKTVKNLKNCIILCVLLQFCYFLLFFAILYYGFVVFCYVLLCFAMFLLCFAVLCYVLLCFAVFCWPAVALGPSAGCPLCREPPLPRRRRPENKTSTYLTGNWRATRRATCGEEPGIGFWNFRPAIPVVFAEGSLRTHRLTLVGKRACKT